VGAAGGEARLILVGGPIYGAVMTTQQDAMARIGAAVELSQTGERASAREALAEVWEQVDAPLHRCAVAHALADVQDDPHDELAWDLRALDAAGAVTDADVVAAGMPGTAAALLPSLHLNVADAHSRVGDLHAARRHVELGLAAASALGDDGYGRMIRAGLDRLAARLSA
jgi:hypothetical protein